MLITDKLDFWKKRLLDLGRRNRLINCPLPSDVKRVQRQSLLIKTPSSNDLWKLLVENDCELSFPLPIDKGSESLFEVDDLFSLSKEVEDTLVKTYQTQNDTIKTLHNLMRKSREFSEEKGLNALHLAFGFLNWKEAGNIGQEMRSPLLLLPVKLTQEDLFSAIVLSKSDEEITSNQSLELKLLNDFNVVLPSISEEANLIDYLHSVSHRVKGFGWSVSYDVTQLSLFSFTKINMYRDLERNSEKICGHQIIRGINGEVCDSTNNFDLTGYDHDNTEPGDVFSVVDADSSQQDAILLAKKGASFVLQGPPGTGKSQTITNIIAELIAEGKKVLFVSEKMAALEVVYKRLTQVGLGNFCLTLHSHNAKRREILDQFEKSIEMSRSKIEMQKDAFNKLFRLKETRSALNLYNTELHTLIMPLGKTIFQVNGFLAQHENYCNIDFVQKNAEKFNPELLSQCESALEEVTRIVAKSGYQNNNPWNGSILSHTPTFEFRQRFLVDSTKLLARIEEGLNILADTNVILDNQNYDWSFGDIAEIKEIFNLANLIPMTNIEWLSIDMQLALSNLDGCEVYIKNIKSLENEYFLMSSQYERMMSALQSERLLPVQEFNNSKICNLVETYNSLLELKQSQIEDRLNCSEYRDKLERIFSTYEKAFIEEQKLNNQAFSDWQKAQSILFERFAESVLLIDFESLLTRYRTNYRSWTRTFSRSYYRDRKSILGHCKTDQKLTYEQGLLLLDEITKIQDLKTVFEKQAEITLGASSHFEQARRDLDEIVDKLAEIAGTLNDNNVNLDFAKIELSKEASEAVTKLSQHLSEYKSLYFSSCDYLTIKNIFDICISEDTDFSAFRTHLVLCMKLQCFIQQFSLGAKFVEATCRHDMDLLQKSEINLGKLLEWEKVVTSGLAKFMSLFNEEKKRAVNDMPLFQLSEFITNCRDNFSNLEYLIDYRIALERLKSLGIDEYLEKVKEIDLHADEIIPVFKKCFFRSWLDAVIPYYSAISEFRRLRQDERVEIFKDLDKSHLEISKAMLISKLTARLPNFDAYSTNGEMALLRREMAKQRKFMPTRLLIAALPNLLPTLKPCIMMSPLSVSTYLGSSPYEFDTVIFDEASQVRTEDAIGAIFRAKQAIIAGDRKQLPPTDFFNSTISTSDDYEEDAEGETYDAGAYESLLDEAIMLPPQPLKWHYRSRHESLIAFSNSKFYEGKLITFPSSVEKIHGMGVEYAYVNGGIYDRGGENGNKVEAEKVAEMVFEHFRDFPERSIGIIAFGKVQQSVILEALMTKRRANPTFETFFKEDREDSLFVKNLETVQGDERDTIIFSIGYAPDVSGKFIMNFGPLSRDGGERRLNVAITRARYNLKLVGSILPTDIDVERTSGQGPKLLRLYIDYAMNGINTLLGEATSNNALWFDSPFESSVFEFLLSEGFKVETQVGCSGYRIDIAVRHPKYNGRYALGIECDGAMYHSARTARERDRLRQTVLEDMGWKIYRIWSTDWIKDRHTERTRLLKAVKDSIDNYREIPPTSGTVPLKMTDYVKISTKTANERMKEGIKKKIKILQSRYYGCSAKNIPVADISNVMLLAIGDNYGIVKSELFKEVAQFGYGWERQGPVIKGKFERAYADLVKSNKIEEYQDCKIKIKE